jgi:DNA-binding CsgD family transcriptional regulator
MGVSLTAAESRRVVRAATVLAAPLEYPTVDHWRAAVNREAASLLDADSVGFLLPVPHGGLIYSDEHDAASLAQFDALPLPQIDDGRQPLEHVIALGAATLTETYQGDPRRYLNSAHFRELAAPNHAFDTLCGMVQLTPGDAQAGAAGLLCWHERAVGRRFGARERDILQLLLPALRIGATTALSFGNQRPGVVAALDDLDQPALVCDARGRAIHRTPRLERELVQDAERDRIMAAMTATANALLAACDAPAEVPGPPLERSVTTARARYAVRGTLLTGIGPLGERLQIVRLERLTPIPLSAAALQEEFGLTGAEARVAVLLAGGASNSAVAAALHISPHTARHHTEAILTKVGVGSRTALVPRLLC